MNIGFPPTELFLKPATLLSSAQAFVDARAAVTGLAPKYLERVDVAKLPVTYVILQRWAEVRAFAVERKLPWPLEATLEAAFAEWARVWEQAGITSIASAKCDLACFRLRVFKQNSKTPAPAVAHASVRADKWLHQFPIQDQPSPITGRRVQIVVATTAAEDGFQSLTINGQQCLHLSSGDSADLTFFDWCRAHVNNRTAQLWVSFHTRNLEWSQGPLQLIAGAGLSDIAVNETVVAVNLSLVISHVTSSDDGRQAIVHVHSECSHTASVTGLLFDGRHVDIHQQNVTIPPGGHAVFVTQVQWQMRRGDVWTAVLFVDGIETGAAYGGRTVGERFVTETWPKMNDCPLPSSTGIPNANATELAAMGIDSVYCGIGCFRSQCAHNAATAEPEYIRILEHAASNNDSVHVFLDGGDKELNSHIPLLTRAKTVDAVLIGDEVDGALDAKHLRGTLNLSLESIRSIPDVPVYIGAATHAMVGAFAGIADIQGIDAYAAACAPTQLAVNKRLPLQYPYYYLRNARDNHAPNTMWGYSQLVHWNW